MAKLNTSKYEIMCFFPAGEKQKKEELVKKIQRSVPDELEIKNLETEKLNWPVRVENYLLLRLTTSPEKILQVEKTLRKLPIQYLLINLDKEKQIKIKKISQENILEEEKPISNSEPEEKINSLNKR